MGNGQKTPMGMIIAIIVVILVVISVIIGVASDVKLLSLL